MGLLFDGLVRGDVVRQRPVRQRELNSAGGCVERQKPDCEKKFRGGGGKGGRRSGRGEGEGRGKGGEEEPAWGGMALRRGG